MEKGHQPDCDLYTWVVLFLFFLTGKYTHHTPIFSLFCVLEKSSDKLYHVNSLGFPDLLDSCCTLHNDHMPYVAVVDCTYLNHIVHYTDISTYNLLTVSL